MTASPLLLWMPSLYSTAPRPSCAERLCPGVRRLWPGLPANMAAGGSLESACVPADLPYGPRACRAFMNDVEVFVRNAEKGQAGSGVLAALMQDSEAEKRLRRETDEVRRLLPGADKDREPDDSGGADRLRAQQLLLWIWRQQSDVNEIQDIVEQVNGLENSLADGCGVEDGGAALQLADSGYSPPLDDLVDGFLPEWRLCVAAAAALCPGAVFFLEGGAAQEAQERFAFSPDPELARAAGMPEGMTALSFEGGAGEILEGVPAGLQPQGALRLAVPVIPPEREAGPQAAGGGCN